MHDPEKGHNAICDWCGQVSHHYTIPQDRRCPHCGSAHTLITPHAIDQHTNWLIKIHERSMYRVLGGLTLMGVGLMIGFRAEADQGERNFALMGLLPVGFAIVVPRLTQRCIMDKRTRYVIIRRGLRTLYTGPPDGIAKIRIEEQKNSDVAEPPVVELVLLAGSRIRMGADESIGFAYRTGALLQVPVEFVEIGADGPRVQGR